MLQRPTALVTGASAGIGREIARILADDHNLILTSRREVELHSLAEELRARGASCLVIPLDLCEPHAARTLFEAVVRAGQQVDALVNNAGFGDLGPFSQAEADKVLRMIQLNVTAFTELLALVLPGMSVRGGGRILNVGSVAGFQPGPYMAAYYATKAYVNSLSQALFGELEGTGVTVTCLCPGPTESELRRPPGSVRHGRSAPGRRCRPGPLPRPASGE